MIANTYYDIAINDLIYLQNSLSYPGYNQITVQIQQICEKLLKSVAEIICVPEDAMDALRTHNLRKINSVILKNGLDLHLDPKDLAYLKDFYFDAKYPGENFVVVSREECEECLEIMYTVLQEVNNYRSTSGYTITEYSLVKLPMALEIDAF